MDHVLAEWEERMAVVEEGQSNVHGELEAVKQALLCTVEEHISYECVTLFIGKMTNFNK